MEKFVAASDLHGIEQNYEAVAAFKLHVKDFKPKHRFFLGDLWNFAALRRQAAEEEKSIRLKEDFEEGLEFLDWYRPQVFIWGNHDMRLLDAIKRERVNRTGWLAELAETYFKKFEAFATAKGIKFYPYDKHLGTSKTHDLTLAHGFGSGNTLGPNMAEVYGNVLYGHGHKIERVTAMSAGSPVTAYQIGCLARNDMEYTRAELSSLRQEQGWAYGLLGKRSQVFQARFADGEAVVAKDFKTYGNL